MLKVNAVSNIVGQTLTVAVALVTVPLYTKFFGLERYGSYLFLLSIQPYFGLADTALGRNATISTARMQRDPVAAGDLSATVRLGVVVSLLLATAFLFAYPYISREFSGDPAIVQEVAAARPYIVLLVVVTSLIAMQTGLLEGRSRFLASNGLQLFGTIASTVVPILPGLYDGSFDHMVAGVLLGRVAQLLLGLAAGGAWTQLRLERPPRPAVRRTLKDVFWLSLTSLGATVSATIDRLLLGIFFGAAQLYYYAVPSTLAARMVVISGSLGKAIAPVFAVSDRKESARLSAVATDVVMATITGLILFLSAFAHDLLSLWISTGFADRAALLFRLALISLFGLSLAQVPAMFLFATNRAQLVVKLQLVEVVPYVAAVFVAGRAGLVAVAVVALVRNVLVGIAHMYLAEHNAGQMVRAGAMVALQLIAIPIFQLLDGFSLVHRALAAAVLLAASALLVAQLVPDAFAMLRTMAARLPRFRMQVAGPGRTLPGDE